MNQYLWLTLFSHYFIFSEFRLKTSQLQFLYRYTYCYIRICNYIFLIAIIIPYSIENFVWLGLFIICSNFVKPQWKKIFEYLFQFACEIIIALSTQKSYNIFFGLFLKKIQRRLDRPTKQDPNFVWLSRCCFFN